MVSQGQVNLQDLSYDCICIFHLFCVYLRLVTLHILYLLFIEEYFKNTPWFSLTCYGVCLFQWLQHI